MNKIIKLFLLFFIILSVNLTIYSSSHIKKVLNKCFDPRANDDGWEISSLKSQGIRAEEIKNLTGQIILGKFAGIHSFLIIKNGKLVHEAYFKGLKRENLQTIFSITKSFSSTLIGIAIDQGFIKSENESILALLPQYKKFIEDKKKYTIKLKHILTLSTGLDWEESRYSYSDPRNSETQMVTHKDWIKFVLTRRLKYNPGESYVYNTGSVHLLSAIIKKATGLYADQFAQKYLFKPLGIKNFGWNKDPLGYANTGATHGGLRLKPRDLAKFGLMVLRGGLWKGKQIVSREWLKKATSQQMELKNRISNCGYLWWPGKLKIKGRWIGYIASFGYGGQMMYLFPDLDMIVIFTCWARSGYSTFLPLLKTLKAALHLKGE